jgi:vacuolar protein sorting-associated protein 29
MGPLTWLHKLATPPRFVKPLTHSVQFKKLLSPGKIGQVLCLGNITDKETYDFLRATAPDLQIVKGDFDTDAPNLALSKVVQHGGLRIGFTHGHTVIPQGDADSLLITARQMDVDVLLWGGTHRFEAYELEGKFFVNPGSASGAFSTGWWPEGEEPTPSFCLMDVSNRDTDLLTETMLMGRIPLGPRRCPRSLCLPITYRLDWCRECGSGESIVQKARSGSRVIATRWLNPESQTGSSVLIWGFEALQPAPPQS